ncbi:hypothetical protein [Vibrio sp. SCSIO 43136]|uniref:hypothetical protein n=1 Tax=Vibrio sp. SCSIO 43136 TaxID=2819101 RepID=UPI002074E4B3|nr:hypothetical protein [Vibrio sp. SCSIO 43136]USD65273.1 hypothetical protein J4N39_14750 [Vibrio sp. SCSIO 43136]
MLDRLDRLTIYTVLGFISVCALVLQQASTVSLLPIIGLTATLMGIGVEMFRWQPAENNN